MTDQVTTKVCGKCKADKTLDFFSKDASKKYGASAQCKICFNEAAKASYEANPEKVKATKKAWREANPEKVKATMKAWREANPEKVKATMKAWREANPEKVKATNKARHEANPEKVNAMRKAWREANPEKVKATKKAYVDRCNDNYVAACIGLKPHQCPQELIELKRINILITRELRNQQQCQN